MSAVIGFVLFTIAVLVLVAALIFARRPNAPAWLTDGVAATLITITTIALAATGLGLVGQFALSYGREPLSPREVIVLIGTSVILLTIVFAVMGRAFSRKRHSPPEIPIPVGGKGGKKEPISVIKMASAHGQPVTTAFPANESSEDIRHPINQ